MELHLKHMKEITDKLAAIEAPISEEDQVVTLLGSLPSSYSGLVTTLECINGVKLSYVQPALLHEERKQRETSSSQPLNSQVGSSSALAGIEKSKRQVRCYGCGELGHIRRFCHNVKRENVGPPHKAKTAEGNHSDNDGVFAASVGSLCNSQSKRWLVDLGASSHMT